MSEFAELTEDEFRRLCEFLYRRTGMVFTEAKRYYVERRVVERMTATGSTSFASYFAGLRSDLQGEVEQFVNAFTVNETYFYREDHQLSCLTRDLLDERVRAKKRGDAIRIWSVPRSTGEEPYSIAIWLLENWPLVDDYEIEIVGSDTDTGLLQLARRGVYGNRRVLPPPPPLTRDVFSPAAADPALASRGLPAQGAPVLSARLCDRPKNAGDPASLAPAELEEVEAFLAAIDAHDDVQNVFVGLAG